MVLRSLGALGLTILGFALGGPIGAAIGSLVGAALFAPRMPGTEGPRADDLQITSSAAGRRIPYIAGRFVTDGNVIWGQEIEEVATTRRVGKSLFSSGTKVTEYTYFATFALALCEGEIAHVLRVWAFDKLLYDGRDVDDIGDQAMYDQAQLMNAVWNDTVTVYKGTAAQVPDPIIEAAEGAANVPGFRGLAYVVFNRLPLDEFGFGARIPQLRIEVCRPIDELAAGVDNDNTGTDVL